MTSDDTYVIRNLVALQSWQQQLRNVKRPLRLPTVDFQLPQISTELNHSFSRLARDYQKACGCASSGFFMSLTVVAMLAAHFLFDHHPLSIDLRNVLAFAGITTIAALFGKVLGLMWARWQLLRLARKVHHTISDPTDEQ